MNFRYFICHIVCLFLAFGVMFSQRLHNNTSGFTENKGQWHSDALFKSLTNDGEVWITKKGIVFTFFPKFDAVDTSAENKLQTKRKVQGHAVFMEFNGTVGKNQRVEVQKKLPSVENYILGNKPSKWKSNVPTYESVIIKEIYPGISAKYYKNDNSFRYDFILEPNANPNQIQFTLKGIKEWSIDKNTNSLVFVTNVGEYKHAGLKAFQIVNGKQITVPCTFQKKGKSIGFDVQRKFPDAQLIIDPIVYSTYLGGSSAAQDIINDVAIDVNFKQKEEAYFVGSTSSTDFPIKSGTVNVRAQDAFVVKFSSTSGIPVYTTFIGGDGEEEGFGIVVDKLDRAWICGSTMSTNFPVRGASGGSLRGGKDGFIVRLNNGGSAIEMGRYVGGESSESLVAIDVDDSYFAYVVGNSGFGFPTSANAYKRDNPKIMPPLGPPLAEVNDAVVGRYSDQGVQIWASYIGAAGTSDIGFDIKVDASGSPIVSVETPGTGYPTTSGAIGSTDPDPSGADIGITKFNSAGTALIWSTVIGGTGSDGSPKIDIDPGGNVYCTATTTSSNFPIQSPAQSSLNGGTDVVVFKINSVGSAFAFSTYCGGNDNDFSGDICVDIYLRVFLAFHTNASLGSFIGSGDVFQSSIKAGFDGAILRLSSTGQPDYGTYFGGTGNDFFKAIAVDRRSNVYVGGVSISNDYPVLKQIDNIMSNGDAVATKFCIGPEPCTIQYDPGSDITICEGETIQIGAAATNLKLAATYEWFVSSVENAGVFNDKEARPYITPKATTKFYGIAYDGTCCPILDSVLVTVIPLPKINAGRDTTICEGSAVKIGNFASGGGNFTYAWSPATNLSDPASPEPIATPKVNTKYTVTVTDISGEKQCIAKDEIWINVNQRPVAQAGIDQKICAGVSVKIGSNAVAGTPPYIYSWKPATNLDNAAIAMPTASPTVTTEYIVTVSDTKGCISIDTVKVEVQPQILSTLPSSVTICADQEYTLKSGITGGKAPFKARWEPPTDLNDRFALEPKLKKSVPGTYSYTVTVEDENKCTISKTIEINVRASVTLVMNGMALNFGTLSSCTSSKIDSIEISNNEPEPVSFMELVSVTPDYSFAGEFPIVIPASGKAFVPMRFVPSNQGIVSGDIKLRTDLCNLVYTIPLTGSKDGLLTKAEPSSVIFPHQRVCDTQKDTTIIIRNTSTKDIIYSFDKVSIASPFEYVSPKEEKTIKPNSIEQITIRINTATAGQYNGALAIPFTSPDCSDTLRVPISSVVMNPILLSEVNILNIGTLIGCEQSKDTTLLFMNNSGEDIVLSSVNATGIGVQSSDIPVEIKSGEQKIIRLTITPTGDGIFNQTVDFISEPCTIKTPITIAGNKTGVVFIMPDTLDFGSVPTCISANALSGIFKVQNGSGGNTVGTITGIHFTNTDFSTSTPSGTLVPNGGSTDITISYTGSSILPKQYLTKAIVEVSPCDMKDTVNITMTAEIPDLQLKDGGIVTFTTSSSSPQSKSLVLENKNSYPWTIKTIVPQTSQVMVKPAGNNTFPITVPAQGSIAIDVTLQANATITVDTLTVHIETGIGICTDIKKGLVTIGQPDMKAKVTLGQVTVKPGEFFDYKIELNNIPDIFVGTNQRFSGVLQFNKKILTDKEKKCVVSNDICTMTLQTDLSVAKNNHIFIPLLALLGDTNVTKIELLNPQLGNLPINFSVDEGSVTIENTCTDEQRYFILTPPTQINSINPNPVNSILNMKFSVSENGQTNISIVDLFGNKRAIILHQDLHVGEYDIEMPIDIGSGTYTVLLETLTRQHSILITVVE